MTRNPGRRVRAAAPVYSPVLKERIQGIVDLMLSDNKKARVENADGTYTLGKCEEAQVNSQEMLYQEAYGRAAERTQAKEPEGE